MRALPLLAILAACTAPASPEAGFRDAAAIIASKADHDPARLAGRWIEVARFPDGGCAGGIVEYGGGEDGVLSSRETCGGSVRLARVEPSGPGRMIVARGDVRVEEWVLWMDADARTLVLARPDGSGGRVLDRQGALPADRRRAVETVLDFNGFDPARLVFSG